MSETAYETRQLPYTSAKAEDIPEIGRIVVRSWQHTFDGLVSAEFLDSMSDDHQCRRHERMFAIQGVVYYVAVTNDGNVIGFCSGGPSRRPAYAAQSEIYAIYLMPGFEQRGIGRRLFEHVVSDIAADVAPSFYPVLSSFPAVVLPCWAGEATGAGAEPLA